MNKPIQVLIVCGLLILVNACAETYDCQSGDTIDAINKMLPSFKKMIAKAGEGQMVKVTEVIDIYETDKSTKEMLVCSATANTSHGSYPINYEIKKRPDGRYHIDIILR
jgi:hypothetical protein